jgi:hypothetical protein
VMEEEEQETFLRIPQDEITSWDDNINCQYQFEYGLSLHSYQVNQSVLKIILFKKKKLFLYENKNSFKYFLCFKINSSRKMSFAYYFN